MKKIVLILRMVSLTVLLVTLNYSVYAAQGNNHLLQSVDIKNFVRQIFIHGIPYEEASAFSSDVVPTLLEMLSDPAEETHWSNIVITLGMIGDERAVDPLINFVNQNNQGVLSHPVYTAKTSAIISLGYLINKTGDDKALKFLTESTNPNVWLDRKISWTSLYLPNTDDRNMQLSKMAILGLAVSGHPDSRKALEALKQPATTKANKKFQERIVDLLSDAIQEHGKVSKYGLPKYYKEIREKQQRVKRELR